MKNNKQVIIGTKPQPPIFYSIVGFTFIFAWLMLAYYVSIEPGINTHPVVLNIYTHFVFWKFFTLLCLIYGIWLQNLNPQKLKPILATHLLIIIAFVVIAFVTPVLLFAMPILVFGALWTVLKTEKQQNISITIQVLALFALLSVIGINNDFVTHPFFYKSSPALFYNPLQNLSLLIADTNLLAPILYGFIIVAIGLLIGKSNWLFEYHFMFAALKKMFGYSLIIILFWGALNFFKVYHYFSQWHWGYVFFAIDALAINLVIIYGFLYLLIYLENYKLGKIVLRYFEWVGKGWPLQAVALVFTTAIVLNSTISIGFEKAVILCLGSYLFVGLVGVIRQKITIKQL